VAVREHGKEQLMRALGLIVAIIGVVLVVLALLDHFAIHFLAHVSHGSIILGVIGVVVFLIGGFLSMQPRATAQ
jgi:hypothetical protein